MYSENKVYKEAIAVIQQGSTAKGLLASPEEKHNYQRVWARDSVITGIACLMSGKDELIASFAASLNILAYHQSKQGQIPSNVSVDEQNVSYGTLAGRVDAMSWYAIGCCAYALVLQDLAFAKKYQSNIKRALNLLSVYEMNNRGLIYTPVAGNWADEYILNGYLLYDQLLRLWALKLYQKTFKTDEFADSITKIDTLVRRNYKFGTQDDELYHSTLYRNSSCDLPYWVAGFHPGRYFKYFDAFGNALALLLLQDRFNEGLITYFADIINNHYLVPAFLPVINEDNRDWLTLKENYNYEFKNRPNEYHNGGIWPMVNLWVGWAMFKHNRLELVQKIAQRVNDLNSKKNFSFYEHFNARTLEPLGTEKQLWSSGATIILCDLLSSERAKSITKTLFD